MIESAKTLAGGSQICASICVVGAGPAGISLALRLGSLGQDVLLVEGGGETETDEGAEMNRGD
eukprot:gene52242-71242_t